MDNINLYLIILSTVLSFLSISLYIRNLRFNRNLSRYLSLKDDLLRKSNEDLLSTLNSNPIAKGFIFESLINDFKTLFNDELKIELTTCNQCLKKLIHKIKFMITDANCDLDVISKNLDLNSSDLDVVSSLYLLNLLKLDLEQTINENIIQLLNQHESEEVKKHCLYFLGETPSSDIQKEIAKFIYHENSIIKYDAIRSLQEIVPWNYYRCLTFCY